MYIMKTLQRKIVQSQTLDEYYGLRANFLKPIIVYLKSIRLNKYKS